jgi:hypothetical protein
VLAPFSYRESAMNIIVHNNLQQAPVVCAGICWRKVRRYTRHLKMR